MGSGASKNKKMQEEEMLERARLSNRAQHNNQNEEYNYHEKEARRNRLKTTNPLLDNALGRSTLNLDGVRRNPFREDFRKTIKKLQGLDKGMVRSTNIFNNNNDTNNNDDGGGGGDVDDSLWKKQSHEEFKHDLLQESHFEEQNTTEEFDFDNISVIPLTPRSHLEYHGNSVNYEIRLALEQLVAKQKREIQELKERKISTKVYIHSQIPLDDEHPMEEKSYKIETLEFDENIKDEDHSNKQLYDDDLDKYALSKHPLYQLGVAVSSKKGNSHDFPNQDNYFIYLDPDTKYVSLFDGHGPCGHFISFYCCIQMAKNILQDPLYLLNPLQSLEKSYHKMKHQIKDMVKSKECPFDTHLSGTSATTLIIRENWIHVAHLGDIKIMKGKKNKARKSLSLELLTNDHIPSQVEEKKRIYRCGGEVRKLTNDCTERIFVRGRMFPNLTVSRSFGDDIGSMIGVLSEADIFSVEITNQDLFLLVGSDPVFSYLDDTEILNVMNYASKSKIKESVDMLIKRAKNAWLENDSNSFDDMSLVCIFF